MTLTELLGDTLLCDDKKVETQAALKDSKAVALYFSAHWCPPCRQFTPALAKMYTKDLQEKGLEVVFVSSDSDDAAFKGYFGEQPWLALPYEARDLKDKLSKKFKVSGIPTLVILDSEGKTITTDGRSAVTEDPEGKNFPWIPKSFNEIIGAATVVDKDGKQSKFTDLKGKHIGLYFSAHWCPPCKQFTPKLIHTYKKVQEANNDFEIVFVSSDRDEDAFKEYYAEMPWMALDYLDRDSKNALSKHFDVNGIPSFVILDPDMKLSNGNARGAIDEDPEGEQFPWNPKPVNSMESPDGINDTPSLIAMMEHLSVEAQEPVKAAMESIAVPALAKAKASDTDPEVIYFVAEKKGNTADQVRKLTGIGNAEGDTAQVLLLDCGDGGAYYKFPTDEAVNEETMKAFLKKFADGELEKNTFG